jgi:hypothetical protein
LHWILDQNFPCNSGVLLGLKISPTLPRVEEQLSRSLYYNIKDLPLWHFKVWRCSKSISTRARYVTPDSKIYCEKVRLFQFSSGNWFFSAPDSCTLPRQVNGATQLCTSKKKSVINWTWLRLSIFSLVDHSDWSRWFVTSICSSS